MELKENGIYIAEIYGSIAKIKIIENTETSIFFENLDSGFTLTRINKSEKRFNGEPVLKILEDLSSDGSILIPKQLLKG